MELSSCLSCSKVITLKRRECRGRGASAGRGVRDKKMFSGWGEAEQGGRWRKCEGKAVGWHQEVNGGYSILGGVVLRSQIVKPQPRDKWSMSRWKFQYQAMVPS